MLLALAALEVTRSEGEPPLPEAVEALHLAVTSSRVIMRVPDIGGALDWSPDGRFFVTEGPEESGIVDIRDADTGESVRAFRGHHDDINDVAFSEDGSVLATSGDDGSLRLWDPETATRVARGAGTRRARAHPRRQRVVPLVQPGRHPRRRFVGGRCAGRRRPDREDRHHHSCRGTVGDRVQP